MEGSSKFVGQQYHARSISLPCWLHSASVKVEIEVNKLKTSVSTAFPSSPDTIQSGLVDLAELYNCLEELIHSRQTQQALLQHQNGAIIEDTLEVSIGLLESCGTLKDLITLMKENVQDLKSVLRRKGGDLSIQSHLSTYFCFRKKAKKIVTKSLRALKKMESKTGSTLALDVDQHLAMVVRVLREVSDITISLFRSLLLFFSVSSSKTKSSGRWSLISNLVVKSSTVCERGSVNEVEGVDLSLYSLHGKVDLQIANRRLQKLDSRIECFEAGLDCLFRRLIQSRASLLNIVAN